jgi:DNA repair protein SbcC/Rad50
LRPIRLDLEGFASFREPTTLDLGDADVFVLSGPTGAGKSSLIDAMTFVLYGSVPRYDDRRLVAPIISQGMAEARVRLDFTVGDAGYTAVRVVRRTKNGGATTKEARLEKWRGADPDDADVMAGTADEVNSSIESLLGLTFEHFTTCIALPQGAFQAFLHAKPKDRNDLLVELLDLDVYRRVGVLARDRAKEQELQADLLQRRLDGELSGATEDALRAAGERRDAIESLVGQLDQAQPQLDQILDEGRRLKQQADEARQTADQLAGLELPEGVTDLAARLATAKVALERSVEAATQAGKDVDAREHEAAEAGDLAVLSAQRERLDELDRISQRVASEGVALQEAQAVAASRAQDKDTAGAAVAAAEEHLRTAERADLAATLAHDLHAGDDCPVCRRPLDVDPEVATGDLAKARDELERARQNLDQATDAANAAAQAVERARAQHEAAKQRHDELTIAVDAAKAPTDRAALDAAITAAADAQKSLTAARTAHKAALDAERQARQAADHAEAAVRDAWSQFDQTWQRVAKHEPPAVDRDDLVGAWSALGDWAAERVPALQEQVREAETAVEQTREHWRKERARLEELCRGAGLDLGGVAADANLRDLAVTALERARAEVQRIQDQIDQTAEVRRDLAEARQHQQIAKALGNHLTARKFEQWLLRRALQRLVAGATVILGDLSNGAYSLGLDDNNNFQVTDHANADEVRNARTLSGGETFLASLSLALALADAVAELAPEGAPQIESTFLDEGFGTLDADTLDTVAAAIEELGASGRLVAIVTHIRELADRMPVRLEVTKAGGSSTVQRVEV